MTTAHDTQSYFQANAEWVQKSSLTSQDQAFKDLFISFLTVKGYRDLLFNPSVNLRNDISSEFIHSVMIPDFSTVMIKLRDYTGSDRRGILEAYGYMDLATRELYKADKEKGLIDALMDCRNNLHSTYQQLEHLSRYLAALPPI